MLKLSELKEGDIVMVDFDGQMRIGDVMEVSIGDRKAKVAHGDNEFWYDLGISMPYPRMSPTSWNSGSLR